MPTPRRTHFIPLAITVAAALATLVACGDDDAPTGAVTSVTSATTATTAPPTTLAAPTTLATTTSAPPTTRAPAVTTVPATTKPPAPTTTDPGEISVTVGVDDATDRVETVEVGTPITLHVTNPERDDEFHIHVVDLGDGELVPKGVTKTFKFTVNEPAEIEVESHTTGTVLLVIEVVP